MTTSALAGLMTRLFWQSPTGAARTPLPWDHLGALERERLPFLLRLRPQLGLPVALGGAALLLGGFLGRSHGVFALGAGLVFVASRAYLQAWRRLGDARIELEAATASAGAGDVVEWPLVIRNDGRDVMNRVLVYGAFDGATEADAFAIESDLPARGARRRKLAWKADLGMGRYTAGGLRLVAFDDLGLFPMAVAVDGTAPVVVEPGGEPVRRFRMRESGSATDQGALEARETGDAVSFRGLRPWRVGDPLKRIDWRRSERLGVLLVKEFERIASTDALLLVDLAAANHAQFGALSTFNALREAALSLADWLLEQRVRTRLVTADFTATLGVGRDDALWLREQVRELAPRHDARLASALEAELPGIPVDSLVILCASAANVVLDELWTSLIHLDERRVEVVLILIDTGAYARAVRREVQLEEADRPMAQSLVQETLAQSHGALAAIANKLLARTYVLGPGQSLGLAAEDGSR